MQSGWKRMGGVVWLLAAIGCGGSNDDDCAIGQQRCLGGPGSAAHEVCSEDGAWVDAPCGEGTGCYPDTGECLPPVCVAGVTECTGESGSASRRVCNAEGYSWSDATCAEGEACVATGEGVAECRVWLCSPGELSCSPDQKNLRVCEASRVSYSETPCNSGELCVDGACQSLPPGNIVIVQPSAEGTALPPGTYSMAVVDTNFDNDSTASYPIRIEGEVGNPGSLAHPVMVQSALTDSPLLRRSGTHEHMQQVARLMANGARSVPRPVRLAYDVGDTRTFHFPDSDANGNTVIRDRTGRLVAQGNTVNFWEDQTQGPNSSIPANRLPELVERVDGSVVPRDEALFGLGTDVDGNGRIDVFITNRLPSSSAAAFVVPTLTLFPPGTWQEGLQSDFGEVVYSMGIYYSEDLPILAAVLAHEISHLLYYGQRAEPYLDMPDKMPIWVMGDVWVAEGMANLAITWSGQWYDDNLVMSLSLINEFSLRRLFKSYFSDNETNLAIYGFSSLVASYLFDQAGGIEVNGVGGAITDLGGVDYIEAVTDRQYGRDHIAPLDGRAMEDWYPDMCAAMLATTLEGKLSEAALANPRFRFLPARQDENNGGVLGVPFDWKWVSEDKTGPILSLKNWTTRGSTLRTGGVSFVGAQVGEGGATMFIDRDTARVALVRHP